MFYYFVESEENMIIGKDKKTEPFTELPIGYREVTKELYESIGVIPCSFVEENGVIISIEYIEPVPVIPEVQPPSLEARITALEEVLLELLM